jgi:hypothetical protein
MRVRLEVLSTKVDTAKFQRQGKQEVVSFFEITGLDTDSMDTIFSVRVYRDFAAIQTRVHKGSTITVMFRKIKEWQGKYTITTSATDIKEATGPEVQAQQDGNGVHEAVTARF